MTLRRGPIARRSPSSWPFALLIPRTPSVFFAPQINKLIRNSPCMYRRVNYILKITPARRANDTNENRAEWPQRIVILITTGGLFSRWMYVTWRDVTQSGLALSSGRLSNVQRRATALSALPFWNANFTPMPGYLPVFRDKRALPGACAHASF